MTTELVLDDVSILYKRHGRPDLRAVDHLDLRVAPGEVVGLVGESGCGKSTVARACLRLIAPDAGSVRFDGIDVAAASAVQLRGLRRRLQIIFQDPASALDPRQRIADALGESIRVHGIARGNAVKSAVLRLLDEVGLPPTAARRYPHEFSGGQRQRIGVARALAVEPQLIVADEPVSALDVSIQAQIVNLLQELQRRMGLTYLFVAHDLSVVEHISDRVAVMVLGRIVELAGAEELYRAPRHPYTLSLLSAIPVPDPERRRRRIVLKGDVPGPARRPAGCPFHPRCPIARERCLREEPALREVAPGHVSACHFAEELMDPGALTRDSASGSVRD